MSQTKQAAGERPIPGGRDPQIDATRRDMYAGQLQKGLLSAGAAGLGIGGLYYLSKYLSDKYQAATRLPEPEEIANAPISEVTAPEEEDENTFSMSLPEIKLPFNLPSSSLKKAAGIDPTFIYAPAIGAGAGALIGAARAGKGRKRQNAILGATLGGLGGLGTAAATSRPLWRYVADKLPKKELFPGISQDPEKYIPAETPAEDAWRAVISTTLPAAGAAGGLAIADSVARQSKNEKNLRDIEDARRDYFTAITGREPPKKEKSDEEESATEKQSAVETSLDELYGLYVADPARFEKMGENAPAGTLGTNTFLNYISNLRWQNNREWPQFFRDIYGGTLDDSSALINRLALAGGLGSGVIGAKYMYDRTKAKSEARNLLRAQDARQRMRGLDSPWVDPRELADVKNIAAGEATSARGV